MPTRKRNAAPVKVIAPDVAVEAPPAEAAAPASEAVAVLDMGASAIRLVVAEVRPGAPTTVLEEASRGVLLGKDTFTYGKLGPATMEATLKAVEGFRRIMDTYAVTRYRAVATSAVREAQNRDSFLDRIRLRTGLEMEVIDGSEENRLTYMAVRDLLRDHPALTKGRTLLVEIGGGSADLSFLVDGEPIHSGIYSLGSIRMRQMLGAWRGGHEQSIRLLRRHIHNVVDDIRNEMPLAEAQYFIALGGDVRFAAHLLLGDEASDDPFPLLPKAAFVSFCDHVAGFDEDQLLEKYRLRQAEAETMVPALLAYRELLLETAAEGIIVPKATLRDGLLLDMARTEEGHGIVDFSRQVLGSARALGEKYRYDAPHAKKVAQLATRIFDELRPEHGLTDRHRLLLEVAALLHDIGNFVNLRGHHKHSQYLLSVSEIFGLTQDDMAIVGNVARYHRRACPQRSHLPFMALDRQTRVDMNKLAAILRLANALDADHLQKVTDIKITSEDGNWVLQVEGAGDLTMERLAALARADLIADVFGRRVSFQEVGVRT
jgi:exopolyphosphatase/guanosine-5'-triphosphate,3'-diphosphate pyrophosphatase